MDTVSLGPTGLPVSVVGLGCGGHSRLGLTQGASQDQAADLVRHALDRGVTFIDTAAAYGTETAVGRAVAGRRDQVVISTKASPFWDRQQASDEAQDLASFLTASVEASLTRLGTDYIDIMNLHGVSPAQYDASRDTLLPCLDKLRRDGKVRFLGITELFQRDTEHAMLERAAADGVLGAAGFEVVMVGFNLLNTTARSGTLALARSGAIGTQIMFAVRRALRDAASLQPLFDQLHQDGMLSADDADASAFEAFLKAQGALSLTDAAYRFCRHEPGAHVILTGTGNRAHLDANIASILAPPLSAEAMADIERRFTAVRGVTANEAPQK